MILHEMTLPNMISLTLTLCDTILHYILWYNTHIHTHTHTHTRKNILFINITNDIDHITTSHITLNDTYYLQISNLIPL